MYKLEQDAIEELYDRLKELEEGEELSDLIHEVADSWVPIYTFDLLSVASSCIYLAVEEPEI